MILAFASSNMLPIYILVGLLIFFFVPLIIFLSIVKARRRRPEARGQRGEESVARILDRILANYGGYIINDVIIPSGKNTTQIDHIYFSKKGIFVIETKNYSGRVYGDENSTYWTQVLGYGNVKNQMYNPLKQNQTHINSIKRLIGTDILTIPMVVFVQDNTEYIASNKVFTRRQAVRYIASEPDRYSDEEIYKAYKKIEEFKLNPIATKEEHVDYVRRKHH